MASYDDLKKNSKALRELDKHTGSDVIAWVKEALTCQYPSEYKRAFEITKKRKWNEIRGEIIDAVESQDYQKIHNLREDMLKTDLLLNAEMIEHMKKMKKIIDLGNLAVFYGKQNMGLFLMCSLGNTMFKNAKLESYLLYLSLMGKPRFSNGLFDKF